MKNYFFGVLTGLFLLTGIVIPFVWPPELSLVLNSQFWASIVLLLLCSGIVALLFYTNGGSTRNARFFFGVSLILSASLMYYGLDVIASNAESWKPLFKPTYSNFFVYLTMFIIYAKNIVSFGFAAIGANLTANSITEDLTHSSSGTS
jgi:hypothetical protein